MPGKDDDKGSFRFGTNRQVEITLRSELDDVARKSITEIAMNRELNRMAPLDDLQKTARYGKLNIIKYSKYFVRYCGIL
jgi:hypothetical protein